MSKVSEKSMLPMIGGYAFIIGLVLAVLLGFMPNLLGGGATTVLVLGVLGLIVGFVNVADKEIDRFLVASIAFLVASASLGGVFMPVSVEVAAMFGYVAAFVGPAAALVAIKAIYDVAREA